MLSARGREPTPFGPVKCENLRVLHSQCWEVQSTLQAAACFKPSLTYVAWKISDFPKTELSGVVAIWIQLVLLPDGKKVGSSLTKLSWVVLEEHGDSSASLCRVSGMLRASP